MQAASAPTTEQLDINKILQGIPGVPNISGLENKQAEMMASSQLASLQGLQANWPLSGLIGAAGTSLDLHNLGLN